MMSLVVVYSGVGWEFMDGFYKWHYFEEILKNKSYRWTQNEALSGVLNERRHDHKEMLWT